MPPVFRLDKDEQIQALTRRVEALERRSDAPNPVRSSAIVPPDPPDIPVGTISNGILVAAANSAQAWKDEAAFLCDGVNDHVELAAAAAAAVAAGHRRVFLAPGAYVAAGSCHPAGTGAVEFAGVGARVATTLDVTVPGGSVSVFTNGCTLRNLTVTASGAGLAWLTDGAVLIDNCSLSGGTHRAVSQAVNCTFSGTSSAGIVQVPPGGLVRLDQCIMNLSAPGATGVTREPSGSTTRSAAVIRGCRYSGDGTPIVMAAWLDVTVDVCLFRTWGARAVGPTTNTGGAPTLIVSGSRFGQLELSGSFGPADGLVFPHVSGRLVVTGNIFEFIAGGVGVSTNVPGSVIVGNHIGSGSPGVRLEAGAAGSVVRGNVISGGVTDLSSGSTVGP